jgi:hypothetical protein
VLATRISIAVSGLMPASVASDLHVAQEATALFELWLYPNDEHDVASVVLRWSEPETGRSRRARRLQISRSEFADAWASSPPSLQAAAIAAETGEILRRGFNFTIPAPGVYQYRPKPRNLQRVFQATRHVDRRLAADAEFRRLVEPLEKGSKTPGVGSRRR